MALRFTPELIEEVKARADIVAIVSEHVALRRSGKNYVGLCPFHAEKTPSFTVSPDKQMFHCFGCQAGGDVITFVMRITGSDFPTAMERLAPGRAEGRQRVERPVDQTVGIDEDHFFPLLAHRSHASHRPRRSRDLRSV